MERRTTRERTLSGRRAKCDRWQRHLLQFAQRHDQLLGHEWPITDLRLLAIKSRIGAVQGDLWLFRELTKTTWWFEISRKASPQILGVCLLICHSPSTSEIGREHV